MTVGTILTAEREDYRMRKIAVINLKGGVGKTMTTLSMAYELSHRHNKKVLVCDLDPQANATKFFNVHDYDAMSMEHVFGKKDISLTECITFTDYSPFVDIVPSNLNLEDAVTNLMLDKTQEQNTKLRNALLPLESKYDFCIMDCPPGIGLNVINALCAADDVIVPIKVDKHALDGMEELMDIVDEIKAFNPDMDKIRCLITMHRNEPMIVGGCEVIRRSRYDHFDTYIRYSPKVTESTFSSKFIAEYSCNSGAAVDYRRMVCEYMKSLGGDQIA